MITFIIIDCFFIWRNLNPPHPRMLCAKIGWNWLNGSGEENFLISYFRCFVIIYPCKRARPFFWTNLNPSTKDALWQVWLKLTQWFWRIRFLNFVHVFSLFRNNLPLEKDRALQLKQTRIPFNQECFVPSLVEIGSVVLEKKMKMWKVYIQTDGRTDRRRTTGDQKS